jgi:regulatory protein
MTSNMTEGQKSALIHAGKMLSARMMTRKQVTDKLIEKGHSSDDALFAVDYLEQMRAIDDLEYAHQYVLSRAARGYGEIRIRQELRQRGVEEDHIDQAIESMPFDSGMIEKFILSRAKSLPIDRREASKISSALARKGFLWDDIWPILRKYTEE